MVHSNAQAQFTDEIDIGALRRTVARFQEHHAQRLAATKQALSPRRRRALELLPFLFHRNHPALPGYISPTVPAGIAHYRPSAQTRRELRRLAGGFRDQRERGGSSSLHAVYLMGSSGSIAQTSASDVDVWVCCPAHLHAALWPKVHLINEWAGTLGLTLQSFLVDPESFRSRRPIPGCAMPTLLLDEFYRSATLIAGRYPLWWLIPPGQAHAHDALGRRLRDSRYLDPDAIIDFGPVRVPPVAELAQGAAEELGRALSTPYKSLLKLKLVEAYAHDRNAPLVSHRYKQAIYAGELVPQQLDAYILVYQHLEAHLVATAQDEQLTLVRRLLTQKVLQQGMSPGKRIAELCQQWGIDTSEILEKRTYLALVRDSAQVNAALEAGLRTAKALDTQQAADKDREAKRRAMRVSQLQRLVEQLTTVVSGTIARLNPAVAPNRYPGLISIAQQGSEWVASENTEPIYRCRRLVELALWAHLNNLSNLELPANHELAKNFQQIRVALGANARFHVFANAEVCVKPRDGRILLSRRNDPLDYSGLHRLQVETLDTVTHSASGSYLVRTTRNHEALLAELSRLMNNPPQNLAWEAIGSQRRYRIQTRLKTLHRQLHGALRQDGDRFVFAFGGDLVCAEKRRGIICTKNYANTEALLLALASQPRHTTTFDNSNPRLAVLQ